MNECHFANRKQGTAYVQAVVNGIARVPDELLQVAAPIKAVAGSYLYAPLAKEAVCQLGKVTVPSLPDSISDVWIEANLTPECNMTYKQDVNVVIADLNAQIAALKGNKSNDEPPDVTDTIVAMS